MESFPGVSGTSMKTLELACITVRALAEHLSTGDGDGHVTSYHIKGEGE